jgi:hypothetical protein
VGSYLVAPSEDDEEDADGDIVDVVEVVDDLGMMMMMIMMIMIVYLNAATGLDSLGSGRSRETFATPELRVGIDCRTYFVGTSRAIRERLLVHLDIAVVCSDRGPSPS